MDWFWVWTVRMLVNQAQNPRQNVARTVGGRETPAAREGLASEVVDRVVVRMIFAIGPICRVLSVIGKRSNASVVRDFHSERPASGSEQMIRIK